MGNSVGKGQERIARILYFVALIDFYPVRHQYELPNPQSPIPYSVPPSVSYTFPSAAGGRTRPTKPETATIVTI